jgi:hypothetical protein
MLFVRRVQSLLEQIKSSLEETKWVRNRQMEQKATDKRLIELHRLEIKATPEIRSSVQTKGYRYSAH